MAAAEQMTPTESIVGGHDEADEPVNTRVKLKKSLGVMSVMSMIVGTIIGSGIFISPKGVLLYTGSVGLNLIVWALCGLIAVGGSLCFVELATVVRESGGEWAYIKQGIGGPPAFVAAWMNIVLISVSSAAICLASSEYLLSPFFSCGVPIVVTKMMGVALVGLIVYINSSVQLATRILKALFIIKVLALALIVIGGFYWIATEGAVNLTDTFAETTTDGWEIALAFYSGLWAYEGWNTANFATEEVKNVRRTMPLAILGSIVLVTCLYLLVNISYYAVLTREEVLLSNAVAVDWARRLVGDWSGPLGILFALSMSGSVMAGFFGTSRVLMAVAREGHTVELLSMVSVGDNTPLISMYFRGMLTMIICIIGDISELIDFFSFCAWLFYGLSFTSLILLRIRRRNTKLDNKDVFQIPIVIPIIMILIALYLVIVPIIANPKLSFLYAGIFMVSGLILYLPFVLRKVHIVWFEKVTMFFQLLCRVGLPGKDL